VNLDGAGLVRQKLTGRHAAKKAHRTNGYCKSLQTVSPIIGLHTVFMPSSGPRTDSLYDSTDETQVSPAVVGSAQLAPVLLPDEIMTAMGRGGCERVARVQCGLTRCEGSRLHPSPSLCNHPNLWLDGRIFYCTHRLPATLHPRQHQSAT